MLSPLGLDDVPESFYWVERAAVCRQEPLYHSAVEEVLHSLAIVDAVVVHVDHSVTLHLLHQSMDKVSEALCVVRPIDDLVVDQTLLLTDGTYDGDILASVSLHVDGEISTHPGLGRH